MIYRSYQKQHKNYVQVVEIFQTKRKPPIYTENEKALNDFLGKDAWKTDMNCTAEEITTEKVESSTKKQSEFTTVRPATSTTTSIPKTTTPTKDFIPTTVYMDPMVTYSPPPFPKLPSRPTRTKSTTKQPNLDNLFTIRSTKPTIQANPKENENPDYTELFNWSTTTARNRESSTENSIDQNITEEPFDVEYVDPEIDNGDEFDEEDEDEYGTPQEDYASNEEEDDDENFRKRRKRYQSIRKRQAH